MKELCHFPEFSLLQEPDTMIISTLSVSCFRIYIFAGVRHRRLHLQGSQWLRIGPSTARASGHRSLLRATELLCRGVRDAVYRPRYIALLDILSTPRTARDVVYRPRYIAPLEYSSTLLLCSKSGRTFVF